MKTPDTALVNLCSELARLTHRRSPRPRSEALGEAYRRIKAFAEVRHYDETWCDRVMYLFIESQHDLDVLVAA